MLVTNELFIIMLHLRTYGLSAFCLLLGPTLIFFSISFPWCFPLFPHLIFSGPSLFPSFLSSLCPLSFWRQRILAGPLREVCENAQCWSLGVPTPSSECEKRALNLMPDWPNLLPDSWAFLFPMVQQKRGQKWCGRRGEGTVIVSRSVEILPPSSVAPTQSAPWTHSLTHTQPCKHTTF